MLSFINKIFDTNAKEIAKLQTVVEQINTLEPKMQKLKKADFKAQMVVFKKRLQDGESIDDLLPEVFALTREAAVRTIKMRPFDVQMMAGIVFHQGKIAEQKTGEGKTLSAVPAMVLNALSGSGAHLVTVNDYLARRDAGWMAPVYHLLGLSVAVIFSGSGDLPAAIHDPDYNDPTHDDERLRTLKPVSRKKAYEADITYGTNNEFGFDYLRDNMARSLEDMSQRGHHYAIVDEVDSILIDEARTPLIISAPDTEPTEKYFRFSNLIKNLTPKIDYEIDEKLRTANLTDHGLRKVEKILGVENIYEKDFDSIHHIEQALKAHGLFEKDKDYVIKDDQIIIVDEHTGRLMFGRRYSDGLHQAIEAKEGVKIQQESRTLASISLQNYFRMYTKLAGMTGTAETEAEEFKKIYNLEVVAIPTHRPISRADHADLIYKTTRAKYAAVIADVLECRAKGQPVLIGTKSIDQNEIISTYLKKKKIPHQVLNAKKHEQEASIIAQAGRVGAVTVATNIAGRGVDIVLGGSPMGRQQADWQKEHDAVVENGGLHIIGAVRHESRRIDNQLRGRSGRQGDPGSSRFYVSLEDDIMRIFGGEQVSKLMDFLKVPEDQPLEAAMVSRAIETAQSKVESFHFDQRKSVVDYDDVLNKQREIIYARRASILNEAIDPEKLRAKIKDILHEEIQNQTAILASDGIVSDEIDNLMNAFLTILPLDGRSQKQLKNYLTQISDPEKITTHLIEIVDNAYATRLKQFGPELMKEIESYVVLGSVDKLWMDHLDNIDDLRDGIGLRGYAQKDPLVEYKHEAFNMFEGLLTKINQAIVEKIFRVQVQSPQPVIPTQMIAHKDDANGLPGGANGLPGGANGLPGGGRQNVVRSDSPGVSVRVKSPGRNDPCWCGSGKKFKKCHYPNYG